MSTTTTTTIWSRENKIKKKFKRTIITAIAVVCMCVSSSCHTFNRFPLLHNAQIFASEYFRFYYHFRCGKCIYLYVVLRWLRHCHGGVSVCTAQHTHAVVHIRVMYSTCISQYSFGAFAQHFRFMHAMSEYKCNNNFILSPITCDNNARFPTGLIIHSVHHFVLGIFRWQRQRRQWMRRRQWYRWQWIHITLCFVACVCVAHPDTYFYF